MTLYSSTTSSPTAHLLAEMQLYGVTADGDRDYRPLPDADALPAQIGDVMANLRDIFADTRLEGELQEMLWSLVNSFHRRHTHTEKRLDDTTLKIRDAQREQDGSEIRSVELEKLLEDGTALTETRNAFEAMRDLAAEHYEVMTGSPWLPRTGSKVSHANLTAAMIDSRDFLAAKARSENEAHCPSGTKIAFAGGADYNNHDLIWKTLDAAHNKYPDMVLLHGGSPTGAELIAAKWAANCKVPAVAFKPDWSVGRAAPFKRNDKMLEQMPQGVIVTPGTGITENLADKAKKLGIKVMRVGG
ncbi:DUF2493 domain-containing protein [Aureimonas sp. AU12]|uniref:DUF2493 domain-containing protein n=1 Tax=Aureimonas sp. AU12 TaxID=1638161 RepID=UPI000784874C|nr:DUF2493 domain-containing protein [Aureimonas sp. AU12]